MYWSLLPVALVPPGVVTVTSTVPAVPAGAVAVMVVALVTVMLVAAFEPKLTEAPLTKLVPVIVTTVPLFSGPAFGLMLATVGRAS